MRYLLRHIFAFGVLVTAFTAKAIAQDAYLYIQGDKTIPFYVKIDSVMQPRYGKNYCIAPKVRAGKVNVEILFQQNAYPAQAFAIDMPATGQKGFLLNRQGEQFSLYDLQAKTYLNPIVK